MKIKIIPLDNELSLSILRNLKKELEKIYALEVEISEPLSIPQKFYDFDRRQYRGELLLEFLKEKCNAFRCVGLTSKDMYASNLNFIFGIATINGNACIVSTARLKGERFLERLTKEVMHELGHTFGLYHCSNYCVMRFSNSLYEVDTKPAKYCKSCSNRIMEVLRW